MAIRAVLWDLDGTLLDTLGDLAASVNAALAAHGMPQRTLEEVRTFVGNGIAKLIERAVVPGTDEAGMEAVLASFVRHYREHERDHTGPYPGIVELLDALTAQGIRCAVVSNKIEPAVIALCRENGIAATRRPDAAEAAADAADGSAEVTQA